MPPHAVIQHLIAIHNKRLQKLKEQQALKGAYTDPAISIEIEELETKIAQLQADLAPLKNVAEKPKSDRTTNVCEACGTEFCTPTWSEKPQVIDQITRTSFTFTDALGCIGPRETGQIQACNRSGCSASVPWAEPTPMPTATP